MGGRKFHSKGFLMAILAGAIFLSTFLAYRKTTDSGDPKPTAPPKAKIRNLLIMGIDERRHDIGRADTIILVKINGSEKTVEGISIPRDSLVEVPGHGFTKVNHSYGYGGPELVKSVVEDTFGIRVDNYISVNFTEFENLIDRFGGVTVTVDKDLNYTDKAGDLYINIKKGRQTLDGKTALGFVRFRHDRLGDLGRMKRQQQFIDAIFEKMKDPRMAVSALKTVEKTDLTARDLLALWPVVRQKAHYKIGMLTAPGVPQRLGSGSYYILDANSDTVRSRVLKTAAKPNAAPAAATASAAIRETDSSREPDGAQGMSDPTGPMTGQPENLPADVPQSGNADKPQAGDSSAMQVDISPIGGSASADGAISADPVPESPTSGYDSDIPGANSIM